MALFEKWDMTHLGILFGILAGIFILLHVNSLIFNKLKSFESNKSIVKNSFAFLIIIVGTLVFVISLKIKTPVEGQILKFLGVIISAAIALSATTVLGNLIAGIMNNSIKNLRNGVFIKIGDMQGMVLKKSSFHTEIVLEDGNYLSIPNLYIAKNPVKITRKKDTIVSTTVSLGYDVSRFVVEEVLKEAAASAGLTDPYVFITNLGDFSVVYRIHGILGDSKKFHRTSSDLNGEVLDKLHEKRIEIVSPNFMNQRIRDEKEYIPNQVSKKKIPDKVDAPEEIVFHEAIKSGKIENKKDRLKEIDKENESLKEKIKESDDNEEIEKIKYTIGKNKDLKEKIEKNIKDQTEEINDSE